MTRRRRSTSAAATSPPRASTSRPRRRARTRRRISFRPDASRAELLDAIVGAAASVAAGVERARRRRPGPVRLRARHLQGSRASRKLEALYDVDLRARARAPLLEPARRSRSSTTPRRSCSASRWAGAARGHARAVGITLGTGLGSAFLADGRIVVGRAVRAARTESLHLVPFRGAPGRGRDLGPRRRSRRYDAALDGVAQLAAARRARGDAALPRCSSSSAPTSASSSRRGCARSARRCLVVGGSIARAWRQLRPDAPAGRGLRRTPRRGCAPRSRGLRGEHDWQSVTRCRSTRHSRFLSITS